MEKVFRPAGVGSSTAGKSLEDVDLGAVGHWIREGLTIQNGGAVDEDGEVMTESALVIEQVGSESGVMEEEMLENVTERAGRGGGAGDAKVALKMGGERDGDHGGGPAPEARR